VSASRGGTPRPAISEPYLLLAEGTSDVAFFRALFTAYGIKDILLETPEEESEGKLGLEGYPDYLSGLITRTKPTLRGIIVTRDCDISYQAFGKLCAVLAAAGYSAPANPLEIVPPTTSSDGHPLPALTVVLIPWAGGIGCLETLLLPAAYAKWPHLVPCVEQYCNCLETWKWDINKQSKIRMRALLSSAHPHNPSLSLARIWSKSQTRLPLTDPCFKLIADFVGHFCASV
jgi:hypothetical protein